MFILRNLLPKIVSLGMFRLLLYADRFSCFAAAAAAALALWVGSVVL